MRIVEAHYYGVPMVSFIAYSNVKPGSVSDTKVMGLDPRRIKYELALANFSNAPDDIVIGSKTAVDSGAAPDYEIPANTTVIITRTFLTDLDSITEEQWAFGDNGNITIYVRETILTPAPVDEVPLG